MKKLTSLLFLLALFLFGINTEALCEGIEIQGDVVRLDVKEVDIMILMKEIEAKAGIKVTVGKDLIGKRVTLQFTGKIEDAVRAIFPNYALVYEGGKIKEIIAVSLTEREGGLIRAVEIRYGKDTIGVDDLQGPHSFALDTKGNIFILDTVNRRIQVFSPHGMFLFTIPLRQGIAAEDIAISGSSIFIYYGAERNLYQYDEKGRVLATLPVNVRWQSKGAMKILNDSICFSACTETQCGDVVIGRIENGLLKIPFIKQLRKGPDDGNYGPSGKKYRVTGVVLFREGADMEVVEPVGAITTYPFRSILSIGFLGEDDAGAAYVRTERREGDKLIVEVHKLHDGQKKSLTMVDSHISFWSVKNYSVDPSGVIMQFLPEEEKLRLNFYKIQ